MLLCEWFKSRVLTIETLSGLGGRRHATRRGGSIEGRGGVLRGVDGGLRVPTSVVRDVRLVV